MWRQLCTARCSLLLSCAHTCPPCPLPGPQSSMEDTFLQEALLVAPGLPQAYPPPSLPLCTVARGRFLGLQGPRAWQGLCLWPLHPALRPWALQQVRLARVSVWPSVLVRLPDPPEQQTRWGGVGDCDAGFADADTSLVAV